MTHNATCARCGGSVAPTVSNQDPNTAVAYCSITCRNVMARQRRAERKTSEGQGSELASRTQLTVMTCPQCLTMVTREIVVSEVGPTTVYCSSSCALRAKNARRKARGVALRASRLARADAILATALQGCPQCAYTPGNDTTPAVLPYCSTRCQTNASRQRQRQLEHIEQHTGQGPLCPHPSKVAYTAIAIAWDHLIREDHPTMRAYWCVCGAAHVGHPPPGAKIDNPLASLP